MCEKLKCIKI